MSDKIKYFLYARKSTDEENRQVTSLDSQVRALREFAAKQGVSIHEIIEESRTAKKPGRPRFNEMLRRIEEGEANGLLCWSVNRLYRNPVDEGRVRWLLQNGVIASIQTPFREFFPDDAGLLMGIEGGQATDYLIRMKKDIKRGVTEKLRRGEWPGANKPLGYVYDHRLRNIVPEPKRAKIIETIFTEYANGAHSLVSASARLFELGVKSRTGRPWSPFAVHHFLTNRIYIGVMNWGGEVYEGKFKTFISVKLFNDVQKALKRREKPRKFRKGHQFPFCGTFRCSCGAMISAQWCKGHGGLYRYCRCTRKGAVLCREPYVREESVAAQSLDILRPLAVSGEEAQNIRTAIAKLETEGSVSTEKEIEKIGQRMEPIQAKLSRLTAGYLDELIDEDTYREKKEEFILKKTALKREKERLRKSRSSAWIEPAMECVKRLESMGNETFPNTYSAIAEQVRKIGTNPVISGKTVSFIFSEPYASIPSILASARSATLAPQASQTGEVSAFTAWCAIQGSNPTPTALRAVRRVNVTPTVKCAIQGSNL